MAMLTGKMIESEIAAKRIEIDPFEPDNVQPSSVDLRLGAGVRVYASQVGPSASSAKSSMASSESLRPLRTSALDLSVGWPTVPYTMDPSGWLIQPGILYLMHTLEKIHTDHYATDITGKSSTARVGVQVHLTAGFGDPGFDGQYTLEVTAVHPVMVYPGDLICQARFWELRGPVTSYQEKGRYVGYRALGAHGAAARRGS